MVCACLSMVSSITLQSARVIFPTMAPVRMLALAAIAVLCGQLHFARADCESGQYTDRDGACQACPAIANCAMTSCTSEFDAACTACNSGYSGPTCTDCPLGYYRINGNECAQCPPTPGACNSGIAVCNVGELSKCQCPQGTYVAVADGGYSCSPCHPIPHCQVLMCSAPDASTCDTCISGYGGPQCDTCTAGTYADRSSGRVECRPCPSIPRCTATACSSVNDAYCVLCASGFSGPKCSNCDQGFYLAGNVCKRCASIPNCKTDPMCTTSSDGRCPLCAKGYTDAKCSTCAPGYYKKGSSCSSCPRKPECPSNTRCTSAGDAKCADCPAPADLSNGAITGGYSEGSKITHQCDKGYTLEGLSTRTCLNGAWTGTRPACVKSR